MARILVVEDNPDAAESYALLLAAWGHEARVAHDANSGLAMALGFHPHLVLLDIGLPKTDGYEFAAQLRAQPSLQGLRILALTGYTDTQHTHRSAQDGFDGHFVKPMDPGLLKSCITRLVGEP